MAVILKNAALERDATWFSRSLLMFWRNVLPASPRWESKLRMEKLVLV
jgi:hypothetical protein